jgi:hemolysin III
MISQSPPAPAKHEEFSLPLFLFTVFVTLAGVFSLLWLIAPTVWEAQLISPWWKFLAAFVGGILFNCFVEYFFHRYVLHMPALPGLSRLYRQHTLHHALTRIARKTTPQGRGVLFVENKFPIVEAEQGEGSFFPWYTLAAFAAAITPVLIGLHMLFPSVPWFVAGYSAFAASLILYELFHAINHWPLEKWLPLIEHARWGWFWRPVYSFHLRHHAVIDCNESISGFFGLPIADWIFGTCLMPKTIYADGEEWKPDNFVAPRPRALIRWLDERASRVVNERRAAQQGIALPAEAPKRAYSRGEEIANWLTHGIGAALSVAGLTLLIIFAGSRGDAWHIVSFTVFGLTLLALYTASTLYHLSRSERRKWMFRRMGHAAIFLVIAGTCTPFLLTQLRGPWGWMLFGITWGVCGAGAAFKYFCAGRYRTASTITYVLVGWLIVLAAKPLLGSMPEPGMWLLVAGGLCYCIGVVFYAWRRLRYHHAFWHGFVVGGSTCHFLAVLLFLTPAAA